MVYSLKLGHDISEIMRTRIWGSRVVNQVSLDLKAAFPEAQGFSTDNLYRMARFYKFYSEQKEIVAQVVQQLQPTENKINTFDKLIKRPQDNPTIGILICQKAAIEREESQAVD